MIPNLKKLGGWVRFLLLKTIIIIPIISTFYITNSTSKSQDNYNYSVYSYESRKDISKQNSKQLFIFNELGISTQPTSFGEIKDINSKYLILDEIEKSKRSDFAIFNLLEILNDSLSLQNISQWRDHVYHKKYLAKQNDPEFLTSLNQEEYNFYMTASPYLDQAKEIAKITGLDEKIFLSLFYAESNLTHFVRSSLDNSSWGIIMSPRNARGLAQVTEDGMSMIDYEYRFRKKILKKQEKIPELYNTKQLTVQEISDDLDIGRNYVLHILQKNGIAIDQYPEIKEETNLHQLTFKSVEEAADYEKLFKISFSVLNQLLNGNYVDKQRYKRDPLYAFSVGSAYLYLDYIYFAYHPDIHIDDTDLLEVCIAAYNRGRYGTERDLHQSSNWKIHKYLETRYHWRNFRYAYRILENIEKKYNNAIDNKVVYDGLVS